MSGTMVDASSITCFVDSAGIHAPAFSDILAWLQGQYQGIYGSDTSLGNDTQDGQWLGVLASAINDCNSSAVAAYQNFSPTTAQGAGLSSVVKINGLMRDSPSNSTIPIAIGGTVETTITNGYIFDSNNNQWNLPASITIPGGGTITVTATAAIAGAISAVPQTFRIGNPQQGWQSAIAATAAIPGVPFEQDGALRVRQSVSVALNEESILQGLAAALLTVNNGGRLNIVENDTDSTDANGIAANTIAVVIEGGNATAIGAAIRLEKTLGAGTQGAIEVPYSDQFGNAQNVFYSAPTEVTITAQVTILASTIPGGGYNSSIGAEIAAAVALYINTLTISGDVYLNRLMMPANLYGAVGSSTYDVVSIEISRTGSGGLAANNIVIAWNEAASCPLDANGNPTTITIVAT